MKKWFEQFKTEDWVVVAVSILLLAFAIITPNYLPRIPKHLADTESWGNAIFLFVIVLVILYIGWLLLGRPLKGLFLSLIAVFSVSLLAQITAALPQVSIRICLFLCYLRFDYSQCFSRTCLDETCYSK